MMRERKRTDHALAAARRLRRDRRGGVAVLMVMAAPGLIMVVGLGIEVAHWTVVKRQLQRTADLAALGGALRYALASNAQNAASSAANAAANVAELNGVAGAAARTWNAGTRVLTNNQVTIQVTLRSQGDSNDRVSATVAQTVPLALTQLMTTLPSVTIKATGWAEVKASTQPCLVALAASGVGISAQGNPNLILNDCSVRSNASISDGGSAAMTAPAFYAAGAITGRGITGALHPNAGTITDPYAANPAVQNAFAQLRPGTGTAFSNTPSDTNVLVPGTYSSWTIKGTANLLPGTYYVNGDISLSGQASLSGGDVTIVTSGAFKMTGTAVVSVSAAKSGSTGGAIPGMVFAGTSSADSAFLGTTTPSLTGVLYLPNANVDFGGTTQGGAATGCLQVIAASVTLKGNANLASNCSVYGALPFSSDGTSPVALVQ